MFFHRTATGILYFASGGSRGRAQPLLIFRPNGGPKGRKKNGETGPPYLRVWMTAPPLFWRSGSATVFYHIISNNLDLTRGTAGRMALVKLRIRNHKKMIEMGTYIKLLEIIGNIQFIRYISACFDLREKILTK